MGLALKGVRIPFLLVIFDQERLVNKFSSRREGS